MKLKRNVEVQVYEVLADYKKKIEKSPFISILKFVNENQDGIVSVQEIYEELLMPLSIKACENLLNRLRIMGYFHHVGEDENEAADDNFFELTAFGKQIAEQEVFFEKRRGVIRISLVINNKLIPQRILRVEEINSDDRELQAVNDKMSILKEIVDNKFVVELEKDSFTIDKIEEYYKVNKSINKTLYLEDYSDKFKVHILDFSKVIEFSVQQVKEELLLHEFEDDYLKKKDILQVDFNSENLNLIQDVRISEPYFANQFFESIIIPNVNVSPSSIISAKKWHFEVVKSRLDKYILTDNEFLMNANEIASEFKLFKKDLKNSLSRVEFISKLDVKKDFYVNSKVETIDYLNY